MRTIRHYPDMTIESLDGKYYVAIEIELSEKSRRRTDSILFAYWIRATSGDTSGFLGAVYLTGPKCSPKRICAIRDSLEMKDCVVVDRYEQYPARALEQLRIMLLDQKHREEGFTRDKASNLHSKWAGTMLPDSVLDFLRPRDATGIGLSTAVRGDAITGYG